MDCGSHTHTEAQSVSIIGLLFLGLTVAFVSLNTLGFMNVGYTFDTGGYDIIVMAFSAVLTIFGMAACRHGMSVRATVMILAGTVNLAFAALEYAVFDPTTLSMMDLMLFIVLMVVAIAAWLQSDRVSAILAIVLGIHFLGYFVGGSAGQWMCIVLGIALFILTLAEAAWELTDGFTRISAGDDS